MILSGLRLGNVGGDVVLGQLVSYRLGKIKVSLVQIYSEGVAAAVVKQEIDSKTHLTLEVSLIVLEGHSFVVALTLWCGKGTPAICPALEQRSESLDSFLVDFYHGRLSLKSRPMAFPRAGQLNRGRA
ncbi:hypothetical protein ES703_119200 [subsurface metagenome]